MYFELCWITHMEELLLFQKLCYIILNLILLFVNGFGVRFILSLYFELTNAGTIGRRRPQPLGRILCGCYAL